MIYDIISFSDLSLEAIFQVFFVQGFLFFLFLTFGIKLLSRGTKRINIFFSGFYISISIGFLFNFILVFIRNDFLNVLFYFLILFFLFLGTFFLAMFTVLLKLGEKIGSMNQYLLLTAYVILLFIILLLTPDGLTLNKSTDWHPVYTDLYFIYIMITLSIPFVITFYFSVQIYKSFQNEDLRRRWKYFGFGITGLYIFAYSTLIIYKMLSGVIVLIMSMIDFVLIIISSFLVYYGAIKKI
jgi:hypothetical protein